MKHTPGPWLAESSDRIVSAAPELYDTDPDGGISSFWVATVRTDLKVAEQDRTGCTGANARLIATAPELLAVCQRVVAAWDSPIFAHSKQAIVDAARAAIAKAEGRTP